MNNNERSSTAVKEKENEILTKNQKDLYQILKSYKNQQDSGDFKGLISSVAAEINNKNYHFIEDKNKIFVNNLSREYMQRDTLSEKDVQDFINAVKQYLR